MVGALSPTKAQTNQNRLALGVGALYERGLDVTLSAEHTTRYHHAWEYFASGYLQWDDCADCGFVCPDSFWKNYRTWEVGFAYKPCVSLARSHYGSLRLGAGVGSDTHEVIGTVHLGYEHNYTLRHGWGLYWQARTEFVLNGRDLFRTGVTLGLKIPTN
jgi:hypothetical protein